MNIILYTKEGCPWCSGVLDLFKEKGIPYEERECRSNKANFDELIVKSGQSLTPTLDIDGEILADTDRESVAAYFKKRGTSGF